MEEKSAIDMIHDIYQMLKTQQAKIDLLNQNLAMINNKVNGTLFPHGAKIMPVEEVKKEQPMEAKTDVSEPPKTERVVKALPVAIQQQAGTLNRKNIRIFGHLQDEDGSNLYDAVIRISDSNNNVIKQTKTNRSGHWVSFLPPGKYSIEFSKDGLQPGFKLIELFDGQTEVEVT